MRQKRKGKKKAWKKICNGWGETEVGVGDGVEWVAKVYKQGWSEELHWQRGGGVDCGMRWSSV